MLSEDLRKDLCDSLGGIAGSLCRLSQALHLPDAYQEDALNDAWDHVKLVENALSLIESLNESLNGNENLSGATSVASSEDVDQLSYPELL